MTCPPFEYNNIPGARDRIAARVASSLKGLRRGEIDHQAAGLETRPTHGAWFEGTTPPGHEYFAGNYRGADFECLRAAPVFVDGNRGEEPRLVALTMSHFGDVYRQCCVMNDVTHESASASADEKLYRLVVVACRVFVTFLKIHPFQNGNGHIGRWLVWLLLGRHGVYPKSWPVHERPGDPPYTEAIRLARRGDLEPLERFVLSCVRG